MSSVGRHPSPPSVDRSTPPTWTLTYRLPRPPALIERTSAGAPHGVYHSLRHSASSNEGMGTARVPSRRRRWASAVPTNGPPGAAGRQGARRVGTGLLG